MSEVPLYQRPTVSMGWTEHCLKAVLFDSMISLIESVSFVALYLLYLFVVIQLDRLRVGWLNRCFIRQGEGCRKERQGEGFRNLAPSLLNLQPSTFDRVCRVRGPLPPLPLRG